MKDWAPLIELCGSGEKTLERMRFQFPDDWLYYDQLNGEWSAFQEILRRKNDSIQEQLGTPSQTLLPFQISCQRILNP